MVRRDARPGGRDHAGAGRSDDYTRRIVDFAEREADRHSRWPEATWTIDLVPVSASMFEWTGARAGFTTAVPEVDVVVVGSGIEPSGVTLSEVNDTSVYHFDSR